MKKALFSTAILAAATAAMADFAVPVVSDVTFSQSANSHRCTIRYNLSSASAIVIVDICTNGVSIGDENLHYFTGDCNKVVEPGENKVVRWQSDKSWPGHEIVGNNVTAKVYAWALDNPPDYMVADLLAENTVNYYTSTNALPDGGLTNDVYRTDRVVMRRIHAKGETFQMGSTDLNDTDPEFVRETPHQAWFDHDYWMAIYELTGKQYANLCGNARKAAWIRDDGGLRSAGSMRPMINLSYNLLRESSDNSGNSAYRYPLDPAPDSVLGRLRARTGVAFDLPGEAEWEYACRAGTDSNVWNDGTKSPLNFKTFKTNGNGGEQGKWTTDTTLNNLARYIRNNGMNFPPEHPSWGSWYNFEVDVNQATAKVGSYKPNAWGLYDMHGNAPEICLDYFKENITEDYGAIITTPNENETHVVRGGGYQTGPVTCRSASRQFKEANAVYTGASGDDLRAWDGGCRLVCRIDPVPVEE